MSFKMTNILRFLTKNELFTAFCLKIKINLWNENVCLVVIARGQMSRKTAPFPFSLHRTI